MMSIEENANAGAGTGAAFDPWAPREASPVGGRKRERQQSAVRRRRQDEHRGQHILEWEAIDHLPSRVWSPNQCEWTVHALERAIERNITDAEFAEAFTGAVWEVDEQDPVLRAQYGRFRLVFAVDAPLPRVLTVVYTA